MECLLTAKYNASAYNVLVKIAKGVILKQQGIKGIAQTQKKAEYFMNYHSTANLDDCQIQNYPSIFPTFNSQ